MTPDEILQDFLADRSEAKNATERGVAYDNTIEAIKAYAREMCDKQRAECYKGALIHTLAVNTAPYPKELQ